MPGYLEAPNKCPSFDTTKKSGLDGMDVGRIKRWFPGRLRECKCLASVVLRMCMLLLENVTYPLSTAALCRCGLEHWHCGA